MDSIQDFMYAYYTHTSASPYLDDMRVWDLGNKLLLTKLTPQYTHVEISVVAEIPNKSVSLADFEPILQKILKLADEHKVILTWPWEDVVSRPLFEQEGRWEWLIEKGFDVETQGSFLRVPKRQARQNEGILYVPVLSEIDQKVSNLVLGKFAEWYLSKSMRSDIYFKSDVEALKDFMYANGVANEFLKNTLEDALSVGRQLTPEERFQLMGVLDDFETHIRELLNLGRLNFSKLRSGQKSHTVLIPNFEYIMEQVQRLAQAIEANQNVEDIYGVYLRLITTLGTHIVEVLDLYTIQEHVESEARGEFLKLASLLTPSQKENQENILRFETESGPLTLYVQLWHFKHTRVPNAALSLKPIGPRALSVEFYLDETSPVGWSQVLYFKQVIRDFVEMLSPTIFEGATLPEGVFETSIEMCTFGGEAFGC